MVTPSNHIAEFIAALEQEIKALKKGKGGAVVRLFDGRLLRETSGFYIYMFHLENFLATIDDTPAEIEIGERWYECQIVTVSGQEVQIAIQRNFGTAIQEARIRTNLWFLLEILKKKFQEPLSPDSTTFRTSERLFAGAASTLDGADIPLYDQSTNVRPNASQSAAIEASFGKSLAVIWGPPGTGKTQTIARAVEAHLKANRRVLLVSHANTAVDEALEKVASHFRDLESDTYYHQGKLVRLGVCQKASLEENCPLVIPDKIAGELGKPLVQERNRLLAERVEIERLLGRYREVSELHLAVRKAREQRDALELGEAGLLERARVAELRILETTRRKRETEERLAQAEASGIVKRLVLTLHSRKLREKAEQLTAALCGQEQNLSQLRRESDEKSSWLQAKQSEWAGLVEDLRAVLARCDFRLRTYQADKRAKEKRGEGIEARIAEIDRELSEIQSHILSRARLVATTLTKTFSSREFPEEPFDVLIVDESSMAPLPHLYWAASRTTTCITIVGDFKQLPPICISKDTMARRWLGRSIFDVLGIRSVQDADADARVSLLDTQYRMASRIASVASELFYEGRLQNHDSTKDLSLQDRLSGTDALVLVDTSLSNPWCTRLPAGSRFNLYSALVSASIAREVRQKAADCQGKVGIISPYRPQARLTQRIAEDWGIINDVRVSTIHSFQGGQEPIIIIDCVEGPGCGRWSMVDDTRPDSDARLILNVALTRAQRKVFLVAHRDYLVSTFGRKALLSKVIDVFSESGCELSSEQFVDDYVASDLEKWVDRALERGRRTEPDESTFYTERQFWPVFLGDLGSAQNRVVIMSPFISARRTGRLMDLFRMLRARGVEMRIYTRPSQGERGLSSELVKEAIEHFHSLGMEVVERGRMHQKIGIIDDKVVWEGSLNILSHQDTQEHMRRLEGQKVVAEVVRSLRLDEDEAPGDITDKLCPKCAEGRLVKREGRYGLFFGCSRYPNCDYTEPVSRRTKHRRQRRREW